VWNPETIHNETFVQVLHVYDHWICITNYNSWLYPENPLGIWSVYDSLQNPAKYLPYLKPLIHKFTNKKNVDVLYPVVYKQRGYSDCGLLALGYAHAICKEINPTTIVFNQVKMRAHFNECLSQNKLFDMFPCNFQLDNSQNAVRYDLAKF